MNGAGRAALILVVGDNDTRGRTAGRGNVRPRKMSTLPVSTDAKRVRAAGELRIVASHAQASASLIRCAAPVQEVGVR